MQSSPNCMSVYPNKQIIKNRCNFMLKYKSNLVLVSFLSLTSFSLVHHIFFCRRRRLFIFRFLSFLISHSGMSFYCHLRGRRRRICRKSIVLSRKILQYESHVTSPSQPFLNAALSLSTPIQIEITLATNGEQWKIINNTSFLHVEE